MIKNYILINNINVPLIAGGATVGSALSVSFQGSYSYNTDANKTSDILFTQLALGEGPIYRINPNGPQDIEIDDRYIDDLINFTTNNVRPQLFGYRYQTGTLTQPSMSSFGTDIVSSVRFNSPVILKSGLSSSATILAPTERSVLFFPTNSSEGLNPIDSIKVKFNITDLKYTDTTGDKAASLSLVALVHPFDELVDINNQVAGGGAIITNVVVGGALPYELEVKIPDAKKSVAGYRVSVLKVSDDVSTLEGYTSEVEVIGFDEIRKSPYAYPRTAIAGYAIKSTDFRNDTLPTYTSLVKGLIVDVPTNYNQPILPSGEVDWRQIEVPSSGADSYVTRGYRLQRTTSTLLTEVGPQVYSGPWDGTYRKDWTENPVWIIKYILTDLLNIPNSAIDKYNFYSAAQYCDAVDPATGRFVGVAGFADGGFRFKPNNYLTSAVETLLGLPAGTPIRERRFVFGMSITDNTDAYTLLSGIASSFRGVISYSSGKIRLIIDRPETLPVAMFNETNIDQGSFKLSGIREEDVVTGVDVSYVNFNDHFKKETATLDREYPSQIDFEKKIAIEAIGCTRKSQALRLARYVLDSNSLLKRKLQFTAFSDASDLEIGDIISVSQQISNTSYGYGGVVASSSARNLFNFTEEINNDYWVKQNSTVTINATTAPDGTLTAESLIETISTVGAHRFYTNLTIPTGIHTFSLYAKPNGRNWIYMYADLGRAVAYVNISTGALGAVSGSSLINVVATAAGNGWYRISMTFNNVSTASQTFQAWTAFASGNNNQNGDGVSGVFFWGLQLEAGSTATPYIINPSSNAFLEYYTSPPILPTVFTANTKPLSLKIFSQADNKINYYLLSNTNYSFSDTGFSYTGSDIIKVNVIAKLDPFTKGFTPYTLFTANNIPKQGDLWALGEIDVGNVFNQTADKLFKVEQISLLADGKVNITATEYDQSILYASDNAALTSDSISSINLSYVTPPPPVLSLRAIPSRSREGVVSYKTTITAASDSANYNVPSTTSINYGAITNVIDVISGV